MRRNITCLYLIKFSYWFLLVMPIVVLFYYGNGLTTAQVFILQAIYSISVVILEIPSGYLADLVGRKKTIIFGSIFGFIGYSVYAFSFGFWGFALAEICLGIGQSMISGADTAILYDTLVQHNKKDEYIRYEGRITSVGNFSEAVAGIGGSLLATVSLRWPYIGQAFVALVAIPASIALTEPESFIEKKHKSFDFVKHIIRYTLVDNRMLRWNIIFSSVLGCATLTMAWFVQPYFIKVKIPVSLFGILWTVLNFSVGVSSLYAYRFNKWMGQKRAVLFLTISIPMGFWLSGASIQMAGLIFIFLFYLVRGIAHPILKDYINALTPSEMRATVLSIRNFVIRFLFAITGPFLGWLTDRYSLKVAFELAGTIFFVLSATTVIYYIRSLKLKTVN